MANQYDNNGSEYGQTAFPGGTKKLTPVSKGPKDQYAEPPRGTRSQYDRNGGKTDGSGNDSVLIKSFDKRKIVWYNPFIQKAGGKAAVTGGNYGRYQTIRAAFR